MESLRTSVDNAPLLVNLLRLIRDARSPNYKDHEKGPITFHFGGLLIRDTGNYEEAEELWRQSSWSSGALAPNAVAPFRGPLHLVVFLNDSPVEVWTLQDYREPATDHSVPRDFEQLEALNTLVRVLFAHLRCQEIYGVVLQSCVTAMDDLTSNKFPTTPDGHGGSQPNSPVRRRASWASVRTPHSPTNRVTLRLFSSADECPTIPAHARRQYLWSSDDFVRIDVTVDRTWRHHSWIQPGTQVASPMPASGNMERETTPCAAGECSAPIRASSPGSRRFGGDTDLSSQPNSPEVMGSLGKSSLPTPYLAPATSSALLSRRPRSPGANLSPLMPSTRLSPAQGVLELVLPPAAISDIFESDRSRPSRSSPPITHSSIFASRIPAGSGRSTTQADAAGLVNRLEDVVRLSNADHVRRMGTLVCTRKQSPQGSLASSTDKKSKRRLAAQRSRMDSLVPSISMSALTSIEKGLLSSQVDLEDLGAEAELADSPMSERSAMATEQLVSLLALCSKVKLQHVHPSPFGDLVLSLNLREAS